MHSPLNPNLIDTGTPPIPEAYAWTSRYDGAACAMLISGPAAPS